MSSKLTFEGIVKRIYTEVRPNSDRANNYVVVELNDGGKYPNVVRFLLKQNTTAPCGEGDKVKLSAYLAGREWTNAEGKILYFTDLRVDTIDVTAPAVAVPAAADAKPTKATDWASLLVLASAYGEDQNAVTQRCNALKAKVARKFEPADWQTVADEIVAAHAPSAPAAEFNDDEPF